VEKERKKREKKKISVKWRVLGARGKRKRGKEGNDFLSSSTLKKGGRKKRKKKKLMMIPRKIGETPSIAKEKKREEPG